MPFGQAGILKGYPPFRVAQAALTAKQLGYPAFKDGVIPRAASQGGDKGGLGPPTASQPEVALYPLAMPLRGKQRPPKRGPATQGKAFAS